MSVYIVEVGGHRRCVEAETFDGAVAVVRKWWDGLRGRVTCPIDSVSLFNREPVLRSEEPLDALRGVIEIIDKAGIENLAKGVQLGAMSWLVKATDRIDYARTLVEAADRARTEPAA